MSHPQSARERIEVRVCDITVLNVDGIVNAANSSLLGGGGVDGAIHRAAGPDLLQECRSLGGCPPGEVRLTSGYYLPAQYVLHTVGPIWRGGTSHEDQTLCSCYRNCLEMAANRGMRSLAFPCISTGIYGFPPERAAILALKTVLDFLESSSLPEKVIFSCFSLADATHYRKLLAPHP